MVIYNHELGPSRAEISFDDRKDGSCGVSYIAQEPGRDNTLFIQKSELQEDLNVKSRKNSS